MTHLLSYVVAGPALNKLPVVASVARQVPCALSRVSGGSDVRGH